ncbi:uncharacterized protein LOC8037757 [Ixodes scapularis]|nr:uncharacterized protein LOC8037757 [Ixodes scapularis]
MAARVLVGFSELLDRRRLHFVQEQPQSKTCTFCNSVTKHIYTLGCCHVFCDVCYGQLIVHATNDQYMCPLDNHVIVPDDVLVVEFKLEELGAVFCPNKSVGCTVSGSIMDTIERHFSECEYHQVNCGKCSTPVRHLKIFEHAQSCQGVPPVPAANTSSALPGETQPADATVDTSISKLQNMQSTIMMLRNEVQSLIKERIMSTAPFSAQGKTLVPRSSEEKLNEAADASITDFRDYVKREMDKRLIKYFGPNQGSDGERDDLMGRLDRMEQKLTLVEVKTSKTKSFWHVTGFEAMKSEVDPETQLTTKLSSPMLVSGYTVKFQVDIDRSDPSEAWLGLYVIFLKGPMDEFQDWPVKKPLLFTLVHPESGRKSIRKHLVPGARKDLLVCFSRPSDSGLNEGCGFDRMITLDAMDHEGFVHNDAFAVALSIRQTVPTKFLD